MLVDPYFEPLDPEGSDAWGWDDPESVLIPDVVDLVLEAATMESVFASQRLIRIDGMRRELLREAVGRGGGVTDIVERSIRLELAAAMRITEYAAARMIVQAEALVHRYPAALDSLGGGRITVKHAEILVDALDRLTPDLRGGAVARAVELAESQPVGTFRRSLDVLVEKAQAGTIEERWNAAAQTRRVVVERGGDGMGQLLLYAPVVELHAIFGRVTAMAKMIVGREDETRTIDQVRADVVCDLLVDGSTESLPAEARGIRASVVVTVPVLALLADESGRTADLPVVEGVGPIPVSAHGNCAAATHPGCGCSPIPRPEWCYPSGASSIGRLIHCES